MPTGKIQQIAVIGGGIVGLSSAIALLRRGVATTLVTTSPMRGTASWGNAGHIAVEQVEPLASMATVCSMPRRLFARGGALSLPPREIVSWFPFSLRLLKAARPARFALGTHALETMLAEAMPAWRRLLDVADAPDLLCEQGHYIVWESEDSARRGRLAWGQKPTGTAYFHDASAAQLEKIQAQVARPLSGGVICIGSGQIADPDMLATALEETFLRLGGKRVEATAHKLGRDSGGAASIIFDTGETLSADAIVVAAGVASGALLRPLGHKVPIIAERGYHIQAETDWAANLPPVVFEDRSMIVTRFRNRLRAASFVEFGSAATPPDPRKWHRLEQHAAELGLSFTTPPERWMGSRPTLPDYLPAIGRSTVASNIFYAFGHQHLGLTLGPVTGEAIGALVMGAPSPFPLAPFDLERFGR